LKRCMFTEFNICLFSFSTKSCTTSLEIVRVLQGNQLNTLTVTTT